MKPNERKADRFRAYISVFALILEEAK